MLQEEQECSSDTSRPGNISCLASGCKQCARPLSCFLVHKSSEVQSKKLNMSLCKDLNNFSLDTVVLDGWQKQGKGFQACIERVEQDHLLQLTVVKDTKMRGVSSNVWSRKTNRKKRDNLKSTQHQATDLYRCIRMHSQVAFSLIKLQITALFSWLLYPGFVYQLLGRSETACTVNIQVKLTYTGKMFSVTNNCEQNS